MVEAAGIEPAVFACKANSLPLTNTPKNNMNTVTKECFYCKTLFNAPLKEVKRGHGKFCSHSCSSHQSSTYNYYHVNTIQTLRIPSS